MILIISRGMGNSLSTTDHGEPKLSITTRNKLCKPRVGRLRSRRRILWLLPGAKVSKQRCEPAHWTCYALPEQPLPSRVSSDPDAEITHHSPKSDSSNLRHCSPAQSRHPSSAHSRNSSVCESYQDTCQPHSRRNSTLMSKPEPRDFGLGNGHDPSSVVRRRSQIFAAPPATKTRRQQIPTLGSAMPASQLLALNPIPADRAGTPSGYSVLGVFKRGSLRIVNTVASPTPSTPDARPKRRNSSPAYAGASVRAVVTPTPTPQLTVSPHEDQEYFGHHAGTQAPGVIIDGSVTAGEFSSLVTGAPHSPGVIPHAYDTLCMNDLHESPTSIVGCLSSYPMVIDEPEITPEDKLLLLQPVSSSYIEQNETSISTSCNPVISPDNAILRRASIDNISYSSSAPSSPDSNILELRAGGGYFQEKGIRASQSWSGRVTCGSEWDTCHEGISDMYFPSFEQEESNGGGITTSSDTQAPILALYGHSITHKQNLAEKLPDVVSNNNLRLPESPQSYPLPEKQFANRHPSSHKPSLLGAMNTSARPNTASTPRLEQQTAEDQISQRSGQIHIGTAHSRISTPHTPHNQQSHSCVPLRVPSYTGAEYYHRFALRRQQPVKRICG